MHDVTSSYEQTFLAKEQNAGQDFQTKILGLNSAKMSPQAKEKKLKDACQGFESIFIQKMWQEMRKSVHQSTLLHGREEQFWQDMYDQELAKKMTEAGGVGLAEMMYEQLSSHLTSASKTTAGALQRTQAFMPSQAPLLAENKSEPLELTSPESEQAKSEATAPSFYEQLQPKENSPAKPSQNLEPSASPQSRAQSDELSVQAALSSMRAEVARQPKIPEKQALASVSYAEPQLRQQPVAGDLERATTVRRQAGDQLGSRGVREPLLPQTKAARAATEQAALRRENRERLKTEAQTTPGTQGMPATQGALLTQAAQVTQASPETSSPPRQPLPYAFPRGQAEAQENQASHLPEGWVSPPPPLRGKSAAQVTPKTNAADQAKAKADYAAATAKVDTAKQLEVLQENLVLDGGQEASAHFAPSALEERALPDPLLSQNNRRAVRRTSERGTPRARTEQEGIRTLKLGGQNSPTVAGQAPVVLNQKSQTSQTTYPIPPLTVEDLGRKI